MSATTDSDGDFFIPAKAGQYMVAIEREDYARKLVGVTVPKDSGRHMNAWLSPSIGPGPRGSTWIVEDLRERQAWTLTQKKVLYTHEDLVRMKIVWIYDAVAMNWSRFPRMGYSGYTRDCAVVVNGGPGLAFLDELTIDDVEAVEIYDSFGSVGSTTNETRPRAKNAKVKAATFSTPGSGALLHDVVLHNMTRICPAVYVWAR